MSEEPSSAESKAAESSGAQPAAAPAAAAAPVNPDAPIKVERLGFGANVTEAAKHIKKSVDSQGGKLRASDKFSAWLVPCTSVGLMAAVLCAGWARMAISIICLASLLYYILGRIGIMRTLSERQATLVWHILLGTFLLGIVFSFVYLEIVNRVR